MPTAILSAGNPCFLNWLRARYSGESWRHYWAYARQIVGGAQGCPSSSHSAAAKEKTRAALLRWCLEVGLPIRPEFLPARKLQRRRRALESLGGALPLKRRQSAVMDLLASGESTLTNREIGNLLLAVAKTADLDHRLTSRARLEIRKWVAIRERMSTMPAEVKRHRISNEWAQSLFLFPSPTGGPSRLPQIRTPPVLC